jgi:predicted SAM-dependent methyltransferase
MKKLNIACGGRYHKDWTNIDFHADTNLVKKVNILEGLPFDTNSFDVVYSSHFLEHLSTSQAKFVLKEANRILKKDGILRIVVPDLENLCKEYLQVLESIGNDEKLDKKYRWITIELLDQLVRVNGGGEMGRIFNEVTKTNDKDLADYILHRTGDELLAQKDTKTNRKITLNKIKNKFLYFYLQFVRFLIPKNLRDLIFIRTSVGERHQWMYDRYSLKSMLKELGFKNIEIKLYNTSEISGFNSYFLDMKEDGTPYKGVSSIYIEARK